MGKAKNTQIILEKSQKQIGGIILNNPTCKIDKTTFKDLHWLSFENRCFYHTAVLVYKSKAHLTPTYIDELLQFALNKDYELKSSTKGDLKTIACRTIF